MTDTTDSRADTASAGDRPLVLVTVGTDHHPFTRLVDWADAYAAAHPEVRVLVQHGAAPPPSRADSAGLIASGRLASLMAEAAVVVTHGGPATITEARRAGHLPIAVARDPELGEHVDDHQLRFVDRLDGADMVRCCSSQQQLTATLDKALAQPDDFRLGVDAGAGTAAVADRVGGLVDLLTGANPEESQRAASVRVPSGSPWPEVTVVVPTRDRPELLRATLRSITTQDYPGVVTTLVVFDGATPDHSLADDAPDRPVRVLANALRPGLAGTRNTGILAATTDLVAFCDDDDTWLPEKLRTQVEVLRAWPDTELVCCGIRVVYDRTEARRVLDRTTIPFRDLLRSRLTELHPSTFLVRRDALVDGCGTVSEEIPGSYGEDYELLLRLARRGPVRNVPEEGVRVLWHQRSHFTGRWRTISTALRWLLASYPEFRLVPPGYARVAGQIAFAEAAAGRRGPALEWTLTALRHRLTEPRGYLALAVACGLPADRVLRALHRRGKGV